MVCLGVYSGRRHRDCRNGRRATIGGHRHDFDIDHQRQGPADILVREILVLCVEDDAGKSWVRVSVGEAPEPGRRGLALPRKCEHAFRGDVVNDVELMIELGNHTLVRRSRIDIGQIRWTRLAVTAQRRALPIVPPLPDVPFAIGIVAVERVGRQRHRSVEIELERVLNLLEHVLRKDPNRTPPDRKIGVEAGVWPLQFEDHRVGVGHLDGGNIVGEHGRETHAGMLDLNVDRRLHVSGGELDTIAPEEAPPQLNPHLREIGVVVRFFGCERVVPRSLQALLRIDVPERIQRCLLQAVRLAAGVDGPNVEPAGILDRTLGILED